MAISSTPSRWRSANAAASAGPCAGCRRVLIRQTLANSKPSRAGATRCASPSLPATVSPSGSPNNRAARAEASTTLTVIAIGADQGGGLVRRMQSEPANLGEDFGRRRGTIFPHGRLDDRQEFALQRSVVPLGTLPQALLCCMCGVRLGAGAISPAQSVI